MFYPVVFRLHHADYHCLWFTDEKGQNQFLKDGEKTIHFRHQKEWRDYVLREGLCTDHRQTLYDVNTAVKWLAENDPNVDCEYYLSLWHATVDLAYSENRAFLGESRSTDVSAVYDKLFWGNNLPSLRREGARFEPEWSLEELAILRTIVSDIVEIIEAVFS